MPEADFRLPPHPAPPGPWLYGPRLIAATRVALEMHATQVRKGSDVPYASHLFGTCAIALDHGANEDQAIAALLHDAIEDVHYAPGARDAVAAFGPEVLRIVEACTDADTHPKPPWKARKVAYLEHLADADGAVLLVSAVGQAPQRAVDGRGPPARGRGPVGSLQGDDGRDALELPRARDRVPGEPGAPGRPRGRARPDRHRAGAARRNREGSPGMSTQIQLGYVTLRDLDDADGTRFLEAEWRGGAIVIEGRDVGPGVERFWGEGNRRYEWETSIGPEAIPAMIAALGGAPGDDPLALLKARYDAGDAIDPGIHLQNAGVPVEKWSSVGD